MRNNRKPRHNEPEESQPTRDTTRDLIEALTAFFAEDKRAKPLTQRERAEMIGEFLAIHFPR